MYTKECSQIDSLLKDNPRGLNIRQISQKLSMNRITVAKYLDLMTVEGKLELILFGKSKVYFRARNVPARSLTEYTSNLILILDNEHHVVMCNPRFLDFAGLSEKDTIGASISEIPCDLIEKIMPLFGQGYEQTEKMLEISLKRYNHSLLFFNQNCSYGVCRKPGRLGNCY